MSIIEFESRYIAVQTEMGDGGYSVVGTRFLGQFDSEKLLLKELRSFQKENTGRTTHFIRSIGIDRETGLAYEAQYYHPPVNRWVLSDIDGYEYNESAVLTAVNEYQDKHE